MGAPGKKNNITSEMKNLIEGLEDRLRKFLRKSSKTEIESRKKQMRNKTELVESHEFQKDNKGHKLTQGNTLDQKS